MKKIIVLMSAIIFLSTITIQAKDDSMDNNDQIQSKISSIIAKLNNNEIGKVEIIVIPARLLTKREYAGNDGKAICLQIDHKRYKTRVAE
jgi:hypothetical protein